MPNRVVRAVFNVWESLFHRAFHLEEIEPGVEHLFFIAKRRYIGRPFEVDGVQVRSGDIVIELHVNNEMVEHILREDGNVVRAMVQLLRHARQSMPMLTKAVQQEKYQSAMALYGVTFIHRGIDRFGFHTLPLTGMLSKSVTKWHLTNVLKMLNPDANHLLETHPDVLQPKLVVASKATLVELFGPDTISSHSNSVPVQASVAVREESQYTLQS